MAKFAVVKICGKQYLVGENEEIVTDKIEGKEGDKLKLEALVKFDERGDSLDLGTPRISESVSAQIVAHAKGDKIRVAKFKPKVRYRKVRGFRAMLTKVKIIKI